MAINEDLDPDFLLKIDLMLIIFSPEVTFFEGMKFFDAGAFSVLSARCGWKSKDKDVLKRRYDFLEWLLWRTSED